MGAKFGAGEGTLIDIFRLNNVSSIYEVYMVSYLKYSPVHLLS